MKKSIIEQFESVVKKYPNNIAFIHNDEKMTYLEFDQLSNKYAYYLREKGVISGDCVIISNRRTIWSYIAIMAIIKLNAVYVPLNICDTGYISRIINSINAKKMIIDKDEISIVEKIVPSDDIIFYDDLNECKGSDNNVFAVEEEAIAYVCYTSGTTGEPKGVLVKQKGIVSLIDNASYFSFNSSDVIAQTTTMEFDAFTFEFWGALLSGATLCAVDKNVLLSPNDFKKYIIKTGINKLFLTTSLFNSYGKYQVTLFDTIEAVIAGGDVMDPSSANNVNKCNTKIKVINGYGPTENTTFSTTYTLDKDTNYDEIPIGKPSAGDIVYILNEDHTMCSEGEEGTIYVGGDGVADGYLNNKELTDELFIEDPITRVGKVYNTGDIGYYDNNGVIYFRGRKDEQVKVSGYRIELPHIKRVAEELDNVRNAEVILCNNSNGKSIVLFLESDINDAALFRVKLEEVLPQYMIPNEIIVLSDLPYNTSGKPNKGKLREIYSEKNKKDTYSGHDDLIVILNKYLPSIDDEEISFFDIGLKSLELLQMSMSLSEAFDINISIVDIFTNYNIKMLRKLIKERRASKK